MKKIVFWDLDGTLIDTLEDLGAAVNHALALRDLPQLSSEDFRKMVGHGVRNLVAQALEKAASLAEVTPAAGAPEDVRTDAYIDSALADFKEYYCANIDVFTRPYPGMPELLSELSKSGVKMAVVSNKFQEGTERLVKEFFPDVDFVAILGNRPGWPLKPSPEIVEDVLKREDGGGEHISRADAILVGDSPTDMRTAANGGIDAIAVTWGYSSQEELNVPHYARSVEELRRLLAEV
ncbi:MAG: HAD hydrolase-like protein [Bacteroidales bacterium]|nr:HAD hydrolase-like protein [Bacteroidales bacterium]